MVRIGDVWDSTVDAARGRAATVAPVALLAFVVPALIQSVVTTYAAQPTGSTDTLTFVVGAITLVAAIWGQLTIIGVATDPATTRAGASAQAWRRFGPAIGIGALMLVVVFAAFVPFGIALAASGIDWTALSQAQAGAQPDLSGASSAAVLFAFLYLIAVFVFLFWLGARLVLAYAVVLNERRGAGALRRSIALTKGLTWKIVGVLLLYVVVLLVATFAVQAAVFFLVRLPLGEGGAPLATLIAAVAGALVTAAMAALFSIFTARLYVAAAGAPGKPPAGEGSPGAA